VDTCGANSGSPIILESSGEAIGIHTHGGCELARAHNGGTRIDDARLQDGIRRCAAECFLVGGVAPTAIPLGGADTLYVFFVSADTWWPVTMNDIPVFPIPNNPGLVGLSGYFQVLMYNPVDYPNDPLKSSNGLQATIGIGTQAYGREEGMRLWAPAPPMPGQPFTVAFIVQ
jgi:hypothetical protein